jgi:RNAse (barnase) inhibitor barstar
VILFDSDHHPSHRAGEHELIVPIRLEGKTALLEFLKEALRFPAYFGFNWDALNDCLGDVALGAEKFVLVHHDLPLEGEPTEQRTYLEILGNAARASDRLDAVFPVAYRSRVLAVIDPAV